MSDLITRFAPSPTGHLHIGGARTALFNWLLARSLGGTFLLRIEDTDKLRSEEKYTKAILEAMTWLGLDWDGELTYQASRQNLHRQEIDKLLAEKKAYWCHCTAQEIEDKRQKAMEEGNKPQYDRLCRDKELGPTKGAVVRFKTPLSGTTSWNDLIKGSISFENTELDDLIILKSDAMPTYNLAVVVDDISMKLSHIIRGDDHVNNTPRQILLYEALGAKLPLFAHLPMILGADKTRLSKRHGATSVMAYKEMGYLPEALINYLVRLGWSHGDQEIFCQKEMINFFKLENVGRSAGVFNPEKLDWLNSHYIKESSDEKLATLIRPYLKAENKPSDKYLQQAISTVKERGKTLKEMSEMASFYFSEEIVYEPKAANKFLNLDNKKILEAMKETLSNIDFNKTDIANAFNKLAQEKNLKMKALAQPLRVALSGTTASPDLFSILEILGKDRVLKRLEKAQLYNN